MSCTRICLLSVTCLDCVLLLVLQEEEQRLERERLHREEEEQHRFEEEQLRLVEEARQAEEERLLQAIQVTVSPHCLFQVFLEAVYWVC